MDQISLRFNWPGTLYLLGLVPFLVGLYAWTLHRRRRFAVRYSSLALVRDALPRASWLRRHLPFALLVLALTALIIAASRPASVLTVPTERATVILDLDVSRRMCSADIPPSRLQAAEASAAFFIEHLKPNTQIGIVAFAGFAELIQPPTTDQAALHAALRSLLSGSGDAIGSSILTSLDAIAETDGSIAPTTIDPPAQTRPRQYAPEIIVLLSDGVSDTGPSPLDAAREAAARGVRIYTIGLGTANGSSSASCQSSDPSEWGGSAAAGDGANAGSFPRGIDESTLRSIAGLTGGTYYPASSAGELESVFDHLSTTSVATQETLELTAAFAAAAALLATAAFGLSFLWHPVA